MEAVLTEAQVDAQRRKLRQQLDQRRFVRDAGVQARVAALWAEVTTESLFALSDYAGFKREFRSLFGFEVPGVDYAVPVETDLPL